MVKIPVYFDQPVRTTDQGDVRGILERVWVPVDTSGGASIWTVPGFGDSGFVYRVLCVHYYLANGPAVSYVGVVFHDTRYGAFTAIANPGQVFASRRAFEANEDPVGDFTNNGPGVTTGAIVNADYYHDNVPGFWFDSWMRPYVEFGSGLGGWASVLYEKVRI